jgi:NADH:ubiquinone oxidoreductase subunit 6 (subunit J)
MSNPKPISHMIAGLIIAGVLILLSMGFHFAGIEQTGSIAFIPYIIIVGGLILFINMYGNAMNNHVSFGSLFAYGFKATAMLTLVMIFFTVIFFLVFPEIKEKMFEMAREKMEESGNMAPSDIEKGLEVWSKFFWVLTIGGILLVYAIVGAIGSVIGAALTKKKPINPLDQLGMS